MSLPIIAVLHGGISSEREVSLGSGRAAALAAARNFPVQLFDVTATALPPGLDPARHVVLSTLHGTFGEDGGMQRLLESAGVEYAGCDPVASALTMDKARTKEVVAGDGVKSARGLVFEAKRPPSADDVVRHLGAEVVIKPNDQGSSVGLQLPSGRDEIDRALRGLGRGIWLAEERIRGRELSVGVLGGRAMGVVEIRPKSGVYDFQSKYTAGRTEYLAPAPLDAELTRQAQLAALTAFDACGGRDYGRVDFILRDSDLYFLEINTLPGMKETSLLPMSARCGGFDFAGLVREMVLPAVRRFQAAHPPRP